MPHAAILHTLNRRMVRFGLKFAASAFVLILFLFCGFRAYSVFLAHRAILLLDEARSIQIGDAEESIRPLVARYGAAKWTPPSERTDNCPLILNEVCIQSPPESTSDREYRNAHQPDYTYGVEISPFDLFALLHDQFRGFHLALVYLMFRTPIFWRNLLALRNWDAFAYISIRGRHVEKVSSGLYVEGRTQWLGHAWHLLAEMPPPESPKKTYRAEVGFLELNTGGSITEQTLTPSATAEQFVAARSITKICITSLILCNSLTDLSPRAFEYKRLHPEADSNLE
jgi:hypothetical protein